MAAQPLTRVRLIQILLTLTLLVAAFTWRTADFSQSTIECSMQQSCNFQFLHHELSLNRSETTLNLQSSMEIDFKVSVLGSSANAQALNQYNLTIPFNSTGLLLESGHERLQVSFVE